MISGSTDFPDSGEEGKASLPHPHCIKADEGTYTHILIHSPAARLNSIVLPW